jgi:hypothetical protein
MLTGLYTCRLAHRRLKLSTLVQVIPLESVMKKPQNMPRVLNMAALTVVGINLPFALYGYLLFGDNTQGVQKSDLSRLPHSSLRRCPHNEQ